MEELSRPSSAKICIQIDLLKKLPNRIWLECGETISDRWQSIEYDRLPKYCKHCKRLGHDFQLCKIAHPPLIPMHNPIKIYKKKVSPMENDSPASIEDTNDKAHSSSKETLRNSDPTPSKEKSPTNSKTADFAPAHSSSNKPTSIQTHLSPHSQTKKILLLLLSLNHAPIL